MSTILEKVLFTFLGTAFGFLIRYFVKWGSFYETQYYKRKIQKKEHEFLLKLENEKYNSFIIGDYEVKNIVVWPLAPALSKEKVNCKFNPKAKDLPPPIKTLEFTLWPKIKKQRQSEGKTVTENDTYSIRGISIDRPQDSSDPLRNRQNVLEITFEPSNYKYNGFVNEVLDWEVIKLADDTHSIRKYLNLEKFDWSSIHKIPIHMWFSTVVNVVTNDNYLVVAIRGGFQAIGSNEPSSGSFNASVSVAEGMLRPVDSEMEPPNDSPSPFKTAERGLGDELGIFAGTHYLLKNLELIAMCFDTFRYQPLAVFYVEVDISYEEVLQCRQSAKDYHENRKLIPLPMYPNEIVKLLRGAILTDNAKVELFSNHQQVGAILAGCKKFGFIAMRNAFS